MMWLRRFGWVRYCILHYYKRERRKWLEARRAYESSVTGLIGQITLTWAAIEMMIDHLIGWYHPIRGAVNIQSSHPINFEKKMDYLNSMARDPGFEDGGAAIRAMRIEARRLNKWRKTLVHGVVLRGHIMKLEWTVQVRDFKKPGAPVQRYGFSDADLRKILSEMGAFSSAIAPWVIGVTADVRESR